MGMTTHGVSIQDEMASSVQSGRDGDQTSKSRAVVLEAIGVSKTFAGVTALRDVDFDLRSGEVHALMGENGAGKSTLMKILAGVHVDYDGEIWIEGAPVHFSGVQDAERAGVAIIHQELNLVPELTAAENIFLGREPLILGTIVDHRRIIKAGERTLEAARHRDRRAAPHCGAQDRRTATGRNRQGAVAGRANPDHGRADVRAFDARNARPCSRSCDSWRKRASRSSTPRTAWTKCVALANRVTVLRDGERVLTAPIEGLSQRRHHFGDGRTGSDAHSPGVCGELRAPRFSRCAISRSTR